MSTLLADVLLGCLTVDGWRPRPVDHHTVLVPIGGIQRAVVQALRYGRTLSDDVRAVYVDIDPAATEGVRRQWSEWSQGVALIVLESQVSLQMSANR